MNINLPESYVYPSSINTINIDFDTINTAKIEINNQTYDIDNYTMSFYYDYKSDFKQVKRISLPKKKTYNYLIYYSTLFINPSLK